MISCIFVCENDFVLFMQTLDMKEETAPFSTEYRLDETADVARLLMERYGDRPVWALDAPMGAGKTTLINALCELLGIEEVTSSPTFAIVNEYHAPEEGSVYHIDCYRLDTLGDAYRIGLNEYLESGRYCFVEWPEVVDELLPDDAVHLRIVPSADGQSRTLYCLPEAEEHEYLYKQS